MYFYSCGTQQIDYVKIYFLVIFVPSITGCPNIPIKSLYSNVYCTNFYLHSCLFRNWNPCMFITKVGRKIGRCGGGRVH